MNHRDSPPPSPGAHPSGQSGATSATPGIAFAPVPVRPRRDGWTAAKQRGFIQALAETGIARVAAAAVGMSERSAHKLALREDGESFAVAWDAALQIAARRGASLLFEYALEGPLETVWRDGEIAYQRRRPSEKALFFLLARLDPVRFGRPPAENPALPDHDSIRANIADLPLHLDSLYDIPEEQEEGDGEGATRDESGAAPGSAGG